ncbi:MAG: hypothetical protein IJP94_01150 [Clostridia bacterium]|nr:hypothetical protein [Clostridia bacterium]
MIKLELNSQKELSISKSAKVFKGENLINSIQVTALNPYIGDKRVEDCEFNLHVVLPDKSYIIYPITWSENSIPLTGFVPITSDITSAAQFLKLYIEITSGTTVIGKSNTVKLQVYDSPEEQTGIIPRGQLEEQIAELESELESASILTETLEQLKGTYNSFPDRLADDEAHISANTANITASQSAIVSLTAALSNKLENAPNSVASSNIAGNAVTADKISDNAVTTAKLADNSVTYAKLSPELQNIVDTVPDTPVFVKYLGVVSTQNFFDSGDYCTLGGIYQITIQPTLSFTVGISSGKPCELRYVNGYQIITQTDTQQVFARKVTRVAPGFQAESWTEIVNPRITALENAVYGQS